MTVTGAESYTVRYTHDLNNRLLAEERTGQLNRTSVYTHDRNGNQLTRTVENETVVQTCPITGGEISATNWQAETYAYNVFNQLIRVNRPGITARYTYRADGLRLTKTVNGATTTHVWLRGNIVLERNDTGNVSNRFVHGSTGRLIRSQHHGWYILNARGDVVQRVSNSANILRVYHYSAFGMELTPDVSDTNPFRFAGEYWDAETQTYYLRARRFNPRTGRFTQPDPHWGIHNHIFGDSPTIRNGRNVPSIHAIMQASNLFMFVLHNPMRFIDPSGLSLIDLVQAVDLIGGWCWIDSHSITWNEQRTTATVSISSSHGSATHAFTVGVDGTIMANETMFVSHSLFSDTFGAIIQQPGLDHTPWRDTLVAGAMAVPVVGAVRGAWNLSRRVPTAVSGIRSSPSIGIPFDPKGGAVQLGVDPNTLIPGKKLETLDPMRQSAAMRYAGDRPIIVDRTGRVLDGHHRLWDAIQNNRLVDIQIGY